MVLIARLVATQKLSDADPTHCPNCDSEGVRRQVSAPAFRLSGSGWYETDFKNGGEKRRNLVESGDGTPREKTAASPGAETKSQAESKAESKPEPKTSNSTPDASV